MGTIAITSKTPPVGQLEKGGDGSPPSDEQMREEQAARDAVANSLVPFLQSLPLRPARRHGNVISFELLGAGTWSNLDNYLLLLNVDIGGAGLADELAAVLSSGSSVSVVGEFESLQTSQPLRA
jgi:hypothetical protein